MPKVRKLRHWKQRFDKNAKFIWRKAVKWQGKSVELGSEIPEDLKNNRTKLKRFWEAQVIELAEFEEPNVLTGQVPSKAPTKKTPADIVTKEADRKWTVEGLEDTFVSKKKALAAAAEALLTKDE